MLTWKIFPTIAELLKTGIYKKLKITFYFLVTKIASHLAYGNKCHTKRFAIKLQGSDVKFHGNIPNRSEFKEPAKEPATRRRGREELPPPPPQCTTRRRTP